jgi:TolA-binding protein
MVLGFLCLVCAVKSTVFAQDAFAVSSDTETVVQPSTPAVTRAEPLSALIKAKRNQLKAVEEKINILRRDQRVQQEADRVKKQSEKKQRLEELRLKDPQEYQKAMDEQFEQQRKREQYRRRKADEDGAKQKLSHAQWLEMLKEKNPAMYDLAVRKDTLQAEIKVLRAQMTAK